MGKKIMPWNAKGRCWSNSWGLGVAFRRGSFRTRSFWNENLVRCSKNGFREINFPNRMPCRDWTRSISIASTLSGVGLWQEFRPRGNFLAINKGAFWVGGSHSVCESPSWPNFEPRQSIPRMLGPSRPSMPIPASSADCAGRWRDSELAVPVL